MEGPETDRRSRASRDGALSFLGLAGRAGAVALGTERAREALRRGDARLVLVARDAAAGQRAKVERLAEARGVPLRWCGERSELGGALGQGPLSAVAVLEDDFAQELERRLPSANAKGAGGSNVGR